MPMTDGFGFCDHDLVDYIENRAGARIAWSCRRCQTRGNVQPDPVEAAQRECDWCGDDYESWGTNYKARWISKRFCSNACYDEDLEDRRVTGRKLSQRIRSPIGPCLQPFQLHVDRND